MRVLSVATPDLLPQARVLARSLARHEPEWQLEVALVGPRHEPDAELDLTFVQDELELDPEVLLARYEPASLGRLLLPSLLLARCERGNGRWLHLPPTMWICGRLTQLETAVRNHPVILFPRLAGAPPDDGLAPSQQQLERAGRIAADVMAVDGSDEARRFLKWWRHRLYEEFGDLHQPSIGYLDDDEWTAVSLELAAARFGTGLLDDPGCNLSAWNLHQHKLENTPAGVMVDGSWPLRLMSFEGYDPERPYQLSEDATRVRLSRSPVLKALSLQYGQELIDAGWYDVGVRSAVGEGLGNGLPFDRAMARLLVVSRVAGREFGDLSARDGAEAFTAWLREPAHPDLPAGVNRYMLQRVLQERPDVLAAFPDLYGTDKEDFARWWQNFGLRELDVPAQLVPSAAPSSPAATPAPAPSPASRARAGAALGVRVSGFLGHVLGLGSAARGYAHALEAAGVPVSTAGLSLDQLHGPVPVPSGYGQASFENVVAEAAHTFELICVNPPELTRLVEQVGSDYFAGRRIGVWAWETNTIPSSWNQAFGLVDEIWVNSTFMAQNIGAVSPVPVRALPPAIEPPASSRTSFRLGVPDGFLFLFMFDYLSTIQRKNPVGLIEAFKQAFAPGEGPQLLIKTFNAPLRPLAEEEVLWAVEDREDIHVIDCSLTGQERDDLLASCDCYVSLHRSEGFGLTLVEAMAIGKPVIATAYSGNLDFMNDANSFLVDYEMTRVGYGSEVYPADGEWAEPSTEHAAALMRQVYRDPSAADPVRVQARNDIASKLSSEVTGRAMRERLQQLADVVPRDQPPPPGAPVREVLRRIGRRAQLGRPG